jgi:16S rRNA processing protein RimM
MDGATALAGQELRVPVGRLAALPSGTFYRHDLIGCRVETGDGRTVGLVRDVEGTLTGSRLVVDGADGEVLIPLVAAICTDVDPAAKRIVIDPPDGLIDVNKVRLKPDTTGM